MFGRRIPDRRMKTLKRFLQLPKQDRLLVLQTVLTMSLVRASLVVFSARTVYRLAMKVTWSSNESLGIDRMTWAVRSAVRFVPGTTCLVQALTTQVLLVRRGYKPRLTIGVAKNEESRFRAHAWVVCENEILTGDREVAKYTPLLHWGSECPSKGRETLTS